MSSNLERTIWSRDTGQQTPCFNRSQLSITLMSITKHGGYKPLCQTFSWGMATILQDCRRSYMPKSNTASHDNHKKINS